MTKVLFRMSVSVTQSPHVAVTFMFMLQTHKNYHLCNIGWRERGEERGIRREEGIRGREKKKTIIDIFLFLRIFVNIYCLLIMEYNNISNISGARLL